jgi:Asp-tRNA(Asn)/Glu-tRNA(Gln) amidotransferase C subunit
MNIDNLIEQWEEKHSSLLNDYSKGNVNNEVMQMYRSQMKNILDFIEQLKQVKNKSINTKNKL